ncbi:outer membrane beta-barrel protein [Parvibaculum sp.]|uniref:outer membrane protein n=1 Tax=Parvibaculum sp. TaxID=2024848 RepID=UPI00320E06E6
MIDGFEGHIFQDKILSSGGFMKFRFTVVLAALAALISLPAFAAEEQGEVSGTAQVDILHGPGYYVTGAGGWSWLSYDPSKHYDDINEDSRDVGVYDFNFDNSWIISGAIGTRLFYDILKEGDDLRGELELAYAKYDLSSITATGSEGPADIWPTDSEPYVDHYGSLSGDVSVVTLLANFWYDLPIEGPVVPYAGGGLGIAWVDYSVAGTGGNTGRTSIDGSKNETDFAYQLGLGVRAPLGDSVSVDVGYRWRSILMSGDANLNSNNLLIGLSLHF